MSKTLIKQLVENPQSSIYHHIAIISFGVKGRCK